MRSIITTVLVVLIAGNLFSCQNQGNSSEKQYETGSKKNTSIKTMFAGTYTKKEGHVDGQADGLYALKLNSETGEIISYKTVAEVVNPSFIKVSSNGKYLFAVSELSSADAPNGYFYSFKIRDNDSLQQISKLSTESFAPAHIELDKTENYAFVSNYVGGVVILYAINNDGSIRKQQQIDLENPNESHPHSVKVSADNKRVYIADLGNDKIWIFDFNANEGTLTPNAQKNANLEKQSGPRHFTLSKNGNFAYSVNELNSTVTTFKVLPQGGLEIIQNISTLPENFKENNSTADIHLHPSGAFLYVSNRGHNSIAAYNVDETTGKLALLDHFSTQGKTPRNFAIVPAGDQLYVANQDSNNIVLFEVGKNGKLSQKGSPFKVKTPVCLEFLDF